MTTEAWISIDPGTQKLGYAIWEGDDLLEWEVLTAPSKGKLWDRLRNLSGQLHSATLDYYINAVAFEDPQGFKDRAQRPLSLITGMVAEAFAAEWYPYHQSTVKASCVLRGTGIRNRDKAAVRLVIESLYPQTAGADEDAIDAIAVGHTHIAHMREQAIEEIE